MNEQQQLADLTTRLQARIASAPAHSHTAAQAAAQLADFADPDCPLSTAQKCRALADTLRGFKRGLEYSDATLHHPGDRAPHE
jgi:hypothetical protein